MADTQTNDSQSSDVIDNVTQVINDASAAAAAAEDENNPLFDEENFAAVQNLVARKAVQVDELNSQIHELNEGLHNLLVNDRQLSEAEEQAKESKKTVQKRKTELNNSPEAMDIKVKLQELKDELKDVEESLSNQLLNLYQLTGVQEFEIPATGEVREFVIKARVKAKKK